MVMPPLIPWQIDDVAKLENYYPVIKRFYVKNSVITQG